MNGHGRSSEEVTLGDCCDGLDLGWSKCFNFPCLISSPINLSRCQKFSKPCMYVQYGEIVPENISETVDSCQLRRRSGEVDRLRLPKYCIGNSPDDIHLYVSPAPREFRSSAWPTSSGPLYGA